VNLRNKKRVLWSLAVYALVGLMIGAYFAYRSRHDTICPNGKPPVAQRSDIIGQTEYRCTNGVVVKK
jgi:hypothetical protein